MATPTIILDGTQAYGVTAGSSGTITINSVAYIVNKITPNRNFQEAKDYLATGAPGRARYTSDFDECDIEVQLATSSTASPMPGSTFSMTVDANVGSETWVVMWNSPEQTNDAGAIRVASFTAKKVYNSITTV